MISAILTKCVEDTCVKGDVSSKSNHPVMVVSEAELRFNPQIGSDALFPDLVRFVLFSGICLV